MSEPNVERGATDLTGATIGRFRITLRLGSGGMGEVYRAEDSQLKRTVAIKRLTSGVIDKAPYRKELLREARRASALNHPRIACVYDVFAEGNELFLVMEYIDGLTLRDRMEAPLGIPEFWSIAVQCAEALAAAHEKGILHGDIKPANIMITRDKSEVKMCDFGLARRISAPSSDTDSTLRGIAGTPAYMPPEVVLEEPVDLRADIFSLGVVFYEVLSGCNPFAADSLVATIDRIRNHSPEPLDRVNPAIPAALSRIVSKMLEKDADNRYSNAAILLVDLAAARAGIPLVASPVETPIGVSMPKWKLAGIVLATMAVLAAALAGMSGMFGGRAGPPLPETINLAVLPFVLLGVEPDKQFFAQGLGETVNAQLSLLTVNRPLQVATAGEVRARNVKKPHEAREQLGANVALSCSLQYLAQVAEIQCALLDTATGSSLRDQKITTQTGDSFAVKDRVVEAVTHMLELDLNTEERMALTVQGTQQPGAYDFYLQGRGYLLNFDRAENLENAIAVFRHALESDSRYALAYAGLGEAYWRKHEATKAVDWVEPARGACEAALGLNPKIAQPHACLGMVLNGRGEHQKAADEFNIALNLEPTNDLFYLGLATAYEKLGRPADAEQTYRRAIDLRPHYWAAYNTFGAYLYRIGRHDDAIVMFRQVVALAPDSFRGYSNLGAAYFMLDRSGEAINSFEKSLAIRPNYVAASNLGTLYYFEGQYRRSADAFRQALSLNESNYEVWLNLGDALFWANDPEESAKAYKRASELAEERARVNPRDASIQMALAFCNAALGEKEKALTIVRQVIAVAPTDPRTLFQIAVFLEYRAGRRDDALSWLSKAVERGQTWREIDNAPALTELRKDSRFQQMRRGN